MTRKHRTGGGLHALVVAVRRFAEAVQHVRTGGRTTRQTAVRRATRPPDRCPSCHQPVPHSDDWRDHLNH